MIILSKMRHDFCLHSKRKRIQSCFIHDIKYSTIVWSLAHFWGIGSPLINFTTDDFPYSYSSEVIQTLRAYVTESPTMLGLMMPLPITETKKTTKVMKLPTNSRRIPNHLTKETDSHTSCNYLTKEILYCNQTHSYHKQNIFCVCVCPHLLHTHTAKIALTASSTFFIDASINLSCFLKARMVVTPEGASWKEMCDWVSKYIEMNVLMATRFPEHLQQHVETPSYILENRSRIPWLKGPMMCGDCWLVGWKPEWKVYLLKITERTYSE